MIQLANKNKNILIIDDKKSFSDQMRMLLKTKGYEVKSICSKDKDIKNISQDTDLIILEADLNNQPAFDVCQILKKSIFVTSHPDYHDGIKR